MKLTFSTLRGANVNRLPTFRNKLGALAHKKRDGSDWNPAQWFQALLGELGEFATVRIQFERGELTVEEFKQQARKELADVQIYLDLLAFRSLDKVSGHSDLSQQLLELVAHLGEYANARKKYERGDYPWAKFILERETHLSQAMAMLKNLRQAEDTPSTKVTKAHPAGVDLGEATVSKFNEVSDRVGSPVFIANGEWYVADSVQAGTDKP